jgi:hypothetical protein
MTTNILTVYENPQGKVFIVVAADYTDSLFLHLISKKVKCLPPHVLPAVLFQDKTGELKEINGHMLIAEGTAKDFNDWIGDWNIPIV